MRDGIVTTLVIILVSASAGVGYFVGCSSLRTTTVVSTATLPATYVNKNVFVMNVNGSFYYADDILSGIEVQTPGYATSIMHQ